MTAKRSLDGLNYRQAQQRNSQQFNSFSKKIQKDIRKQGYKNLGWDNVIKSWKIIQLFMKKKTLNFVDFAIEKAEAKYEETKKNSNDVIEVLEAGKSVIRALKMKYK